MNVRIISTVKEFRQYAKKHGYRGYSRLEKKELRELISKPPPDYKAIDKKKKKKKKAKRRIYQKRIGHDSEKCWSPRIF